MTAIPPPPPSGSYPPPPSGAYPPAPYGYGGTPPNNYLVWAILSTLLCCLPFGIVSIVKAAEVNSKWAGGDVAGAHASAAAAKKWAIVSAAVTGGALALYLIYFVFVIGLSAAS